VHAWDPKELCLWMCLCALRQWSSCKIFADFACHI
jgi:hypothetical protein